MGKRGDLQPRKKKKLIQTQQSKATKKSDYLMVYMNKI